MKITFTVKTTRAIKRSLFGRSLCSVRLFQSVVPPSVPQTLHSTKKKQQLEKQQLFFLHCFVPHLHTFSTLRSAGLMHPQYRFIPLHFASYVPLHSSRIMSAALYFSAVALSHSHRGWLRSVKTSLCPKSRNAIGYLIFFPRRFTLISASFRFVPTLTFRIYGGRSIAATPPLRSSKNNNFRYRYNYYFLRCLGVFDCRFQKKHPTEV